MQEEIKAKKIFEETVKRDSKGRYKVKLPWICEEDQDLPSNKKIAICRLSSTTKKLNSNGKFAAYDGIFKEWINEGFIKIVKENEENIQNCHYLPHHPVFKYSITTPVRPVFDASCKYGRNPSLNDCLYKGPNCIELLPAVLMRFRLRLLGTISDVRKAFQMIKVDEQDQEHLRFLWWEDSTQSKIIILKHCRVVFGLVCSPYLLAAVLETHLKNVPESKKNIANEILKSMYVDNCVTSFDSAENYEEFKTISTAILSEAKMELRQWECSVYGNNKQTEIDTRVLGMVWNKQDDNLSIQTPQMEILEKLTKRNISSALHKFFDPIGFTCPALLQPKLMLQQAWKKNVSWDDELPIAWKDQFSRWCGEAHLLKEIKIPRLCQIPYSSSRQLHTFTDASKDAYATVVYLRTEYKGKVEIQLIQAKSRLSPIGKSTIPRLELLGCLIGSRLSASSMKATQFTDVPAYFWSDSTTAIAWIQRNNEWGTFVGNRVKRILQTTKANQWRYVPGLLNPADLPSRGCSPKELLRSKWWEGPEWLKLSSNEWPKYKIEVDQELVSSEKKKNSTNSMFTTDVKSWFTTKFSSYTKKVHVMAWIIRFCHNTRNKATLRRVQSHLTIPELRVAEVDIVRIIQSETQLNSKGKEYPSTINDRGILRLKTPITKRLDTVGFRYPYLLP